MEDIASLIYRKILLIPRFIAPFSNFSNIVYSSNLEEITNNCNTLTTLVEYFRLARANPKFNAVFSPLPQFYTRFLVSISSGFHPGRLSRNSNETSYQRPRISRHHCTGTQRAHNVRVRVSWPHVHLRRRVQTYRVTMEQRPSVSDSRENARNRLAATRNTRNVSRRHGFDTIGTGDCHFDGRRATAIATTFTYTPASPVL